MKGSVVMCVDIENGLYCPFCGQELFLCRIHTLSGPDEMAMICQACETGWPVQEDEGDD